MIMITCHVIPMCLEYIWTFYIMFITSIIALCIEKKGNKGLNVLFFVTGMVTCFLDFLSTEILTLFIPMIFVLIIRYEEQRLDNFKQGLKFIIQTSMLWGIAYIGMWLAKWGLASIILKINAMDYVTEKALNRINNLQDMRVFRFVLKGAISYNLKALYIMKLIKTSDAWLLAMQGLGVFVLIFWKWKNIKKMWFQLLLLLIAIMPYARYLILANHSYMHFMFTFRLQFITIIALLWIIIKSVNWKIIFNKKVITNGINNINTMFK